MDILIRAFLWFLDATAAASVVLLLVLAVQRLLRRRLSPRLVHALWLLVLLRLLVPVFPDSPVSIFHLLQLGKASKQTVVLEPLAENRLPSEMVENLHYAAFPKTQMHPPLMEGSQQPANVPARQADEGTEQAGLSYSLALRLAAVAWLAGAAALILYVAAFSVKMGRQRRRLELLTDPQIVSIIEDCRLRLGIREPVPVYTGRQGKSPYLSGLFRPWIYLPQEMARELSASQLAHILLHELAHHKRKDIMWNAIGSLALAIHWMNPLVWIGMKRMKADRELACDACVLEVLGEAEAVPYGMTIIECLKRFSPAGRQSELLYFFGPNQQMEMKRRIHMIKSFKKGSYKLSVAAVLCVGVLGAATLTNASSPVPSTGPVPASAPQTPGSQSASTETVEKERILFDYDFQRPYASLEKVVKISGFKFKVPAALPDGYRFTVIHFAPKEKAGTSLASLRFAKTVEGINHDSFRLKAQPAEADLEAVTDDFDQNDFTTITIMDGDKKTEEKLEKKKETFNVNGQKIVKFTIQHGDEKDFQRHYFWQDQGVQYEITNSGSNFKFKDDEIISIIGSMKYPDEELYKRFISEEQLNEGIYDTGDVKRLPEAIGFVPKFPFELPGAIQADRAWIGDKMNFSFPENEADKKNRDLTIFYKPKDETKAGVKRVKLQQIKNNSMYETMKKNGTVAFERIDGEKNEVKLQPVSIAGKELLKTVNHKTDGPLSSAREAELVVYFWKEDDVCLKVTFWNDGPADDSPERNRILQFLMNEKPIDLVNFK